MPSTAVIRRLLRELPNARLATDRDLADNDRQTIQDEGVLTFCLEDDFNGDARVDVAVAGRFDNRSDPSDRVLVAIFSKRDNAGERSFMLRPHARFLMLQPLDQDSTIAPQGRPGFIARFTAASSDDYVVIFWDGHSYLSVTGFDLVRRETLTLR